MLANEPVTVDAHAVADPEGMGMHPPPAWDFSIKTGHFEVQNGKTRPHPPPTISESATAHMQL